MLQFMWRHLIKSFSQRVSAEKLIAVSTQRYLAP